MKKIVIGSSMGAMLLAGGVAIAAPGGIMDRSAPITRAEFIARADARFTARDVNKDGKLTPEDRTAAQKARADARFAAMDADKNGQITRAEFDAAGEKRMEMRGERGGDKAGFGKWGRGRGGHHRGQDRMALIDTNKDGVITLEEQRAHAAALFDRQDANKDGTVTPEERKAARDAIKAAWKAEHAEHKGA